MSTTPTTLPGWFVDLFKRQGEIIKKAKEGKKLTQLDEKFISRIERVARTGRPAEYSQELPVFNSQLECFRHTGIPVAIQTQAKKAGCQAFKANRVHLGPMLKYLFDEAQKPVAPQADPAAMPGRTKIDHFKALREEIKYKHDAQLVVPKAEVSDGLRKAIAEFYAGLDRIFCNELPPLLVGAADERAIRLRCKQEIDRLKSALKEQFERLGNETKENS